MARILVIEDDGPLCEALGLMLASAGHEGVMFESAIPALETFEPDGAFDLVVTDILMPEMDGLDVIRAIRRRGTTPPILAISGGASALHGDLLKASLGLGAQGTLLKPFSKAVFLEKVSNLLEGAANSA